MNVSLPILVPNIPIERISVPYGYLIMHACISIKNAYAYCLPRMSRNKG